MVVAAAVLFQFVFATIASASSIGGALYPRSHPVRKTGPLFSRLACFRDSTTRRILSSDSYVDDIRMSVTACANYCKARGYALSGTENAVECRCGNGAIFDAQMFHDNPDTHCNMPCPGNPNQYCGGESELLVFVWN